MIVVLNGPLGIGKSTLAEALTESMEGCAMLSGDALVKVNPEHSEPIEHLHSTLVMLVEHHRSFGYRDFVIEHFWSDAAALEDLRTRLQPIDADFRCFLLTLPEEENLRRIRRRAAARELDELSFELTTMVEERRTLGAAEGLGVPFDLSAPLPELVAKMRRQLRLPD